jgi:hypothetical protein
MANQKEMLFDFVKQHHQDLQALKMQHEASLQAVQEECQCEVRVQQLKHKQKQDIEALQEEIARFMREKDEHAAVQMINVATVGVSTEQDGGAEELDTASTALHTVQQLRDELKNKVLVLNLY